METKQDRDRIELNLDAWWGVFEGRAMLACFPWKDECFEWIRCRGSDYSNFRVVQLSHTPLKIR